MCHLEQTYFDQHRQSVQNTSDLAFSSFLIQSCRFIEGYWTDDIDRMQLAVDFSNPRTISLRKLFNVCVQFHLVNMNIDTLTRSTELKRPSFSPCCNSAKVAS